MKICTLNHVGSLPSAIRAGSSSPIARNSRPSGLRVSRTVPQATSAVIATSSRSCAESDTPGPSDPKSFGIPGTPCTPLVSHSSCWIVMRNDSEKPSVTIAR